MPLAPDHQPAKPETVSDHVVPSMSPVSGFQTALLTLFHMQLRLPFRATQSAGAPAAGTAVPR